MSNVSKTAKASMVTEHVEKKVISDEELVRQARIHLSSGLHISQEMGRALLTAYDASRVVNTSLVKQVADGETALTQANAAIAEAAATIKVLEDQLGQR
jgi:hypothetical protein